MLPWLSLDLFVFPGGQLCKLFSGCRDSIVLQTGDREWFYLNSFNWGPSHGGCPAHPHFLKDCGQQQFMAPYSAFSFFSAGYLPAWNSPKYFSTHSQLRCASSCPQPGISLLGESEMPSANWEIQFRKVENMWNTIDLSILPVKVTS